MRWLENTAETPYRTQWANPTRQRLATRRNRVLRGVGQPLS